MGEAHIVLAIFLLMVMLLDITAIYGQVLSADAFSRFEEGYFNQNTGQSFLDEILTRRGSEEPNGIV